MKSLPNFCQISNKNLIQQLIQWYIQQIQFWHILTEWSILGKTRLSAPIKGLLNIPQLTGEYRIGTVEITNSIFTRGNFLLIFPLHKSLIPTGSSILNRHLHLKWLIEKISWKILNYKCFHWLWVPGPIASLLNSRCFFCIYLSLCINLPLKYNI